MTIFVVGINHKTASIHLREQVYFPLEKLALYLQDLLNQGCAREAVLLSTCNRSELYCEAETLEILLDWFCSQTSVSRQELLAAIYVYQDEAAIAHLMQVACGLDSMILGESQILGQMKDAFSESCAAGAVNVLFHRLFQQVFKLAKEIRSATAIGACPVSVASAAVHFAKQQISYFAQANIVLIGAGETAELLARYLKSQPVKSLCLVNRNIEKAREIANQFDDHIRFANLNELPSILTHADIVFSATGSTVPIITKNMFAKIMRVRTNHPILLFDIAVPRDIEANIAQFKNVKLYCIDDLKEHIEKNRQGREHAANKAREMIHIRSREFITEVQSLNKVATTIRAYRSQVEEICRVELVKARRQLYQGMEAAKVLEMFAHAFTQKLLHTPSVQLRQAGVEGRYELLQFAKQLFAIPDEVELYETINTN